MTTLGTSDLAATVRRSFDASDAAQARLHELVPAGRTPTPADPTSTPRTWRRSSTRGEGARVVDLDGNWFVEYGMGLRSVTLGHGYRPVVDAVVRGGPRRGQLLAPERLGAAGGRGFLEPGPGRGHGEVRQERFGRHDGGGQARPRRAPAATWWRSAGRQPFFSIDDWFIGSTQMKAGIPRRPA